MNNNISKSEIINLIKSKNRIIIISHIRPDGDTLSSAYALKNIIESFGKKAICVCAEEVSPRLSFICDSPLLLPDNIPPDYNADLIITVDVASASLLGDCIALLKLAPSLKIDHHLCDDNFTDYSYTEPQTAACAEIIYDIAEMTDTLTQRVCELLYTGISFDTGGFKYSNVTEQTHKKAAYLVSKGINHAEINTKLFDNKTKEEIAALKLVYNNIQYFAKGNIALICITNKMKTDNAISDNDLSGISKIPLETDGVELGIVLKQKTDTPLEYKVSMRSRPGINVANICQRLNGGGHLCAAGGLVKASSPEEAVSIVIDTVKIFELPFTAASKV